MALCTLVPEAFWHSPPFTLGSGPAAGSPALATIDLGDALPYAEQKLLKLFGKDDESVQLAEWFKRLQATALTQTAAVRCLGMRNPLPFDSIHQPTRLM